MIPRAIREQLRRERARLDPADRVEFDARPLDGIPVGLILATFDAQDRQARQARHPLRNAA